MNLILKLLILLCFTVTFSGCSGVRNKAFTERRLPKMNKIYIDRQEKVKIEREKARTEEEQKIVNKNLTRDDNRIIKPLA
ncbi:MAG: hypothetical protein O3C05_03100 [Proteobacteria bacterium]|nr:hypothetical protein [Pseudomonadota bacterium]